jgi:hypothetical protein
MLNNGVLLNTRKTKKPRLSENVTVSIIILTCEVEPAHGDAVEVGVVLALTHLPLVKIERGIRMG